MSTEPESRFFAWLNDPEYPDPKPEDLERPEFQAVWNAIKEWDLSRRPNTESTRLYAGASGSDVMHILNALPPQLAADEVRESIRAYLQHIADIDIGTVLSPQGREIVGFCASWVENRLDEKWLADKVVPFASAKEEPSPVDTRDEVARLQERLRGEREYASAVLQDLQQARASEQRAVNAAAALGEAERREITARKEAEETVEALRADLEEERKYRDRTEVVLGGVVKELQLWEEYAEELEDSVTSMRRIRDLVAPRRGAPPGCSCEGQGRCDWCKTPSPYISEHHARIKNLFAEIQDLVRTHPDAIVSSTDDPERHDVAWTARWGTEARVFRVALTCVYEVRGSNIRDPWMQAVSTPSGRRRIAEALTAGSLLPVTDVQEPDPLHPTGRCSCGGEGRCDWCKVNDPCQGEGTEAFDDFEPDVEGVMTALQDTQAYIASCLEADVKLEAVRKVVLETEAAIDRRSESPAEAQHRQSVAYAHIQKLVQAPGDTGHVT